MTAFFLFFLFVCHEMLKLNGKKASLYAVARKYGLQERDLLPYGRCNAYKVDLPFLTKRIPFIDSETFHDRGSSSHHRRWNGLRYVVVTGMTPTASGEGKTTTALGLSMALERRLGRRAVCCLRQPSQGPTFGAKGGAHGGGMSRVEDAEALDLHLTGDTHAIIAAHNLIAAALSARMYQERACPDDRLWFERICPDGRATRAQERRVKKLFGPAATMDALNDRQKRLFARLEVDPATVQWPRTLDTCDRALRKLRLDDGAQTSFEIASASEIMAILALCTSYRDLERRVARIVVAHSARDGAPITVDDLCLTGAVCALLRDAVQPTLMASCEGTPVLVHTGPFANIAHGCSSVLADWLAASMVCPEPSRFCLPGGNRLGYVVTEAGFGADVGFEKLCDIKARVSGLVPDCAVLVATVRALCMHGAYENKRLSQGSGCSDVELGAKTNLQHHISTISRGFGVPVVVALNKHASNTPEELAAARRAAIAAGADACIECNAFQHGSQGAESLARAVDSVCSRRDRKSSFRFLYDLNAPIREKIEAIAKQSYGAGRVVLSPLAERQLSTLEHSNPEARLLPICIAKTPMSLTAKADVKGAPRGFTLPITRLLARNGAGFITAYAGGVLTMPGLSARPRFFDVDFDSRTGRILGLTE